MQNSLVWFSIIYLLLVVLFIWLLRKWGNDWFASIIGGLSIAFIIGLLLGFIFSGSLINHVKQNISTTSTTTISGIQVPVLNSPFSINPFTAIMMLLFVLTPIIVVVAYAIRVLYETSRRMSVTPK